MVLRLNGTCDVSSFSESCDSTSDPISGLDDDDLHSERLELLGGRETGDSCSDDEDLSGGRLRRDRRPLVDAEVDVAVALEKSVHPIERFA